MPRGLDPNAVEASLANGELTIWIPKPESLKPQKIEINADTEQQANSEQTEPEGSAGGSSSDEHAPAAERTGRSATMTSPVYLVADYDEGDPDFAEVVQRLALVAPGAAVQLTHVGPCDTIAAGLCVAWLALAEGPADRLIIHDVVAADGDGTRASDPRLCAGRSADGALVLGHNSGWAWSFARGDLHGPCYLDVCAADSKGRAHDVLHYAVEAPPCRPSARRLRVRAPERHPGRPRARDRVRRRARERDNDHPGAARGAG